MKRLKNPFYNRDIVSIKDFQRPDLDYLFHVADKLGQVFRYSLMMYELKRRIGKKIDVHIGKRIPFETTPWQYFYYERNKKSIGSKQHYESRQNFWLINYKFSNIFSAEETLNSPGFSIKIFRTILFSWKPWYESPRSLLLSI